ncbi:MAG: VCBS repeat-containing protein [Candidatus Diapherotrites archaeon]|nr:VCBS repeat-containing protein [Candidatus Diapherotrites archaeon]
MGLKINFNLKYAVLFISIFLILPFCSALTFTDSSNASYFSEGTVSNTTAGATDVNLALTGGAYYSNGTFTSKVFDSDTPGTIWNSIVFDERNRSKEPLPNSAGSDYEISMANNKLLYHMDFSEGECSDSSGTRNDGAVYGAEVTSDCILGSNAYTFDGRDYVCKLAPAELTTSAFTISAWIKTSSTSATQTIFSLSSVEGCTDEIWLFPVTYLNFYISTIKGTRKLGFATGADAGTVSTGTFGTGWTHVAVTYNSISSKLSYYINGSPAGNFAILVGNPSANASVGALNSNGNFTNFFEGNIDELTYFTRILTPTEILNHYKRGIMDLNLQVQSCALSDCSDSPAFLGPDGTASTYFTDSNVSTWDLNAFDANRYFQYKAFFRTDDTNVLKETTPFLQEVRIDYSKGNSITPGDVNISWPVSGTYISGKHSIDFNAAHSEELETIVSIWLSQNPGDLNYPLVSDLNLVGKNYCFDADANWITPNNCKFIDTLFNGIDLNIDTSLFPDGNYVVDINAVTQYDYNYFTSSESFMIDNTAPSTALIEINSGAETTTNPIVQLELSCSDAASGCSEMQFSCSNNAEWVNDFNLGTGQGGAIGIFVGDPDNDSENEIISANQNLNTISIFNWNGSTWTNDFNLITQEMPQDLFIEDSDNDGENELLVTNYDSNSISLYNWNGSNYINDYNIVTQGSPTGVFVGDADNDGDNEIIVANFGSNSVSIYNWDEEAIENQYVNDYNLATKNNPMQTFIEDADNDGENEIIVVNWAGDTVGIYNWNGSNYINDYNLNNYNGGVRLFVGDADNDGENEILTANAGSVGAIVIYNWNGSTWINDFNLNVEQGRNVFVGDIDNDGDNEILAKNETSNLISIFSWTEGNYINDYNLTTGAPTTIFVGDINNDGLNKILIGNNSITNQISIFNWNTNFTSLENYSSSKSFNLTSQSGADCNSDYGVKTVYVKYKDRAGNTVIASDSIEYVESIPDLNFIFPTEEYIKGETHSIDFNVRIEDNYDLNASIYYIAASIPQQTYTLYKDVNLDSTYYCVDLDNDNSTVNTCSFIDTKWNGIDLNVDFNSFIANPTTSNYIQIDINASNGSNATFTSNTFAIDKSPPRNSTISINSGNSVTTSTDLNLSLNYRDMTLPDSGYNEMSFSCDNNAGWSDEIELKDSIKVSASPKSVDLDNDGDNDLVALSTTSHAVYIYIWNEVTESFNDAIILPIETIDSTFSLEVGDVDNDGYKDIAVVGRGVPGWVYIVKGPTWKSFETIIGLGKQPSSIAIGDIDNDGDNDMITSNYGDNTMDFFQWNGNNWDVSSVPATSIPYEVVIADADNDGRNEILLAQGYWDGSVLIKRWNGSGFDTVKTLTTDQYTHYVTVGDADNDGDNDVIAVSSFYKPETLQMFDWNGEDWGAVQKIGFTDSAQIRFAFVFDADNDLNNEILLANRSDTNDYYYILDWNGNGFNITEQISASNGSQHVFSGDINNDGYNDLVASIQASNTLSLRYWDSGYTEWEAYNSSKLFDLADYENVGCSTGYGTKTIYVKYSDLVGNEFITSDSIELVEGIDVNIISPVSGDYWSNHHSIDFNVKAGEYDLNASIYLIESFPYIGSPLVLYKDVNLDSTAYCIDLDNNNATTNTCSFKNTIFDGIDLNIDTVLYADNNYTIQVDINSSSGASSTETSSSFMIDNTIPETANLAFTSEYNPNVITTSVLPLALNCSDSGSNCSEMQFSCSNNSALEKTMDAIIDYSDESNDGCNYFSLFADNVDEDEEKEIIVGYYCERYDGSPYSYIRIYNNYGSGWVNDFNAELGEDYALSTIKKIFVSDSDNDGRNDITVSSVDDERILVFQWNSLEEAYVIVQDYTSSFTESITYEIFIDDADNEGTNDILYNPGDILPWFNGNWGYGPSGSWLGGYTLGGEADLTNGYIADADNDGRNEVLFMHTIDEVPHSIDLYEWDDNEWIAEHRIEIDQAFEASAMDVIVADADNDSKNEIIVLSSLEGKTIRLFEWNGSTWENDYNINGFEITEGELFVADIDNDSNNDILVMNIDLKKIIVYSWKGSTWENDFNISTNKRLRSFFVSDLNNDGLNDLIFLTAEEGSIVDINLSVYNWNDSFTSWENYSTEKSFDLSANSAVDCNSEYGTKTLYTKFKDRAGNTRIAEKEFIYASQPVITVNYPKSTYISTINNSVVDINFTVTDPYYVTSTYLAKKYYSETKGAKENYLGDTVLTREAENTNHSVEWDISSIADGNYYVDLNLNKAIDSSYLYDFNSTDTSVYFDGTRPISSSDANSGWQKTDFNLGISVIEDSNNYALKYRIDLDATEAISWSSWMDYEATGIDFQSDGNYAIDFNATDAAGNSENASAIPNRAYILVDKTTPNSSSDANSGWQNTDANVSLTCSDVNDLADYSDCNYVKYQLDNDSSNDVNYSSVMDWNGEGIQITEDGNWAIKYWAVDNAGNEETDPIDYVLIASGSPVVNITNPTDGASYTSGTSSVTVTYEGTPAGNPIDYYEVRINSGSWINNGTNSSYEFTELTTGTSYTVEVKVVDTALNEGTDSVSFSIENTGGTSTQTCAELGGIECIPGNQTCIGPLLCCEWVCTGYIGGASDTANCYASSECNSIQTLEKDLSIGFFITNIDNPGSQHFVEGNRILFSIIAINSGSENITTPFTVKLWDEFNSVEMTSETINSLNSGEQRNISFEFVYSSKNTKMSKWNEKEVLFTAIVDADEEIIEVNELNNESTATARFGLLSNLTFSAMPVLLAGSDVVSTPFTIINKDAEITTPFKIGVSVNNIGENMTYYTVNSMGKNSTLQFNYNYTFSTGQGEITPKTGIKTIILEEEKENTALFAGDPGETIFFFGIDYENIIVESNEGDNNSLLIYQEALPDLEFEPETDNTITGIINQEIILSGNINNIGSKESGSFNTRVYLSSENMPEEKIIELSSIGINARNSVAVEFELSEFDYAGNYFARIVIDEDEEVTELDETNNQYIFNMQIIDENSLYSYDEFINNEYLWATVAETVNKNSREYEFEADLNPINIEELTLDNRWGENIAYIFKLQEMQSENKGAFILEASETNMDYYSSYDSEIIDESTNCYSYMPESYEMGADTFVRWFNGQYYPTTNEPSFLSLMHYYRINSISFNFLQVGHRFNEGYCEYGGA